MAVGMVPVKRMLAGKGRSINRKRLMKNSSVRKTGTRIAQKIP
jgi:hypothetical protein